MGTDARGGKVRSPAAAAGSRPTPIGGSAAPSFRQNSATAAWVVSRRAWPGRLRTVSLAKVLLWQTTGRRPTSRQMARATGMPEGKVEGLQRLRQAVFSLNRPRSKSDRRELADMIPDHRAEDLPRRLDQGLLKQQINRLLGELDDRERQVVCLRFGLEGGRPLSLRETGRITRLSGERVRQIEEHTMRQARQPQARRGATGGIPRRTGAGADRRGHRVADLRL